MAWLIVDPAGINQNASTFWHIIEKQAVQVRARREMTIHGELLLEGELVLNSESRLRLQE